MKPLPFLNFDYFLIPFVLLLLTTIAPATGFVNTVDATEGVPVPHRAETPPLVSMTIENMPIQQAASLIEKKTKYHIKLQSINPAERVSGQFVETDMETVCTNLLRGYNLLIFTDTRQRLMTVKSLGQKTANRDFVRSGDDRVHAGVTEQNLHQDAKDGAFPHGNDSTSNQRDPFTGMTYADIVALHQKQAADIERDQHNPDNIAPFTDMTHSEIKALHEEQKKILTDTQP